jgi:hypothetical protein
MMTSLRDRPELRLLAFGTVEPRKNQVAVMEALSRLLVRRPSLRVQLDVVGNLHPAVADRAAALAEASDERSVYMDIFRTRTCAPSRVTATRPFFFPCRRLRSARSESLWQAVHASALTRLNA